MLRLIYKVFGIQLGGGGGVWGGVQQVPPPQLDPACTNGGYLLYCTFIMNEHIETDILNYITSDDALNMLGLRQKCLTYVLYQLRHKSYTPPPPSASCYVLFFNWNLIFFKV